MVRRSAQEKHYVNNKEFLSSILAYKKEVATAEKKRQPKPPIPEYIGECFLKIATRLSYKPNFANYSYRDEMVSDGVENCLQYMLNFNPEKSDNPFGYFTQIISYAFLRRIEREKKQVYIRCKVAERANINREDFSTQVSDTRGRSVDQPMLDYENMHEFIATFESKQSKKKYARKKMRETDKAPLFDETDEPAIEE
jgi:hypothetical protein